MIRSLPARRNEIYLTFDDGPAVGGTPAVLDVLARENIQATFFLIADRARAEHDLLARIRREGHAIGNHSLDHKYRHYFRSGWGLEAWVEASEGAFASLGVNDLVGFRPPAGICTPPLVRLLQQKNEPLVLWTHRFYDAVFEWTRGRAFRAFSSLKAGDIVLLHDRQSAARIDPFCDVLTAWVREARRRGFEFAPLTREGCLSPT